MTTSAEVFVWFIGSKEPVCFFSDLSPRDAELRASRIRKRGRAPFPTPHSEVQASIEDGPLGAFVTEVAIYSPSPYGLTRWTSDGEA